MNFTRRLTLLAISLAATCLVPVAARAGVYDPGGFRYASPTLTVHENAGDAVVTIERSNTSVEAQVRYNVIGLTAQTPEDFTPEQAMINFVVGQSTATFDIPIVDHGVPGPPRTLRVGLFGASPIGLAQPSNAVLTIINDDNPAVTTDPKNPLGSSVHPAANGNPLSGVTFYVDHRWGNAAVEASAHPAARGPLSVIADQPGTARFGTFSGPDVGLTVSRFLDRAATEEPGKVPLISTYKIVDGHCGSYSPSPASQMSYHNFIESFAKGIGDYRAVLFLEMDSLITVGCLSHHGLGVRMHELRDAINVLKAHCPRLVIYLDAGAADALSVKRAAQLLRKAGVAKIQGFFLNSTHFDWTSNEIRYGEKVSRLTGGKHFVVNTAVNGQGPLIPKSRVKSGNEVLCNPPGRGLGPKPTSNTGYGNVDAFAWIGQPGLSGGKCVPGAPSTGSFWLKYALGLVKRADFKVR